MAVTLASIRWFSISASGDFFIFEQLLRAQSCRLNTIAVDKIFGLKIERQRHRRVLWINDY